MKSLLVPPESSSLPSASALVLPSEQPLVASGDGLVAIVDALRKNLGEPFALVNVESGDLEYSDHQGLGCDFYSRIELLAEVHRQGTPEIIEEVAPLTMLAIPLRTLGVGANLVAVGMFVNQPVSCEQEVTAAAQVLGVDVSRAWRWCSGRTAWPAPVLQTMATTVLENLAYRQQLRSLRTEVHEATAHAENVCEELDLLHWLTGQLHLLDQEQELWQRALEWLAKTVPAQNLSIIMRQTSDGDLAEEDCTQWELLSQQEPPVSAQQLFELVRQFGLTALREPILLSRAATALPTWSCPTIRELACVPIGGGDQPCGWLLALNHQGDPQAAMSDFGSVEIQLLRSVGTILGIHHSNLGLYQAQSQLFAGAVQALTSAIDAKDGYTAGHSQRVASFSAALAKHLGLSPSAQETIYLGGLLHDIGKIGVDDQVLNKPGELTREEFAQIKQHPQLGYEILQGVQQLESVLPLVLHHHEAWDGSGYPHGLQGKKIPRMARIMAVADAFDAMSGDRPYRQGMPDAKIDAILRAGAGKQWDAEVVEAFFAIRDEIRQIAQAADQPAGPASPA